MSTVYDKAPPRQGKAAKNVHLDTALLALDEGLSPVPPAEDGTKRPEGRWKQYQTAPAAREEVIQWYSRGRTGNGLATGYGNVECLEWEDASIYSRFKEAATAFGLGVLLERVESGYSESSPGGGIHLLYRCERVEGNTKLAERPTPTEKDPNARETLIETRGVGGFIVIAPSNGRVHPSGGRYKLIRGGLETIATISPDEREALFSLARSFDEIPDAPAEPKEAAKTRAGDGVSPLDDFNGRAEHRAILEGFGWSLVHTSGRVEYWRRPGKEEGWSATWGHTKGFRTFTSSSSLEVASHTLAHVYCVLKHQGDWTATVKDLVQQGFGTWVDAAGEEHQNPRPRSPWGEMPRSADRATPADGDDQAGGRAGKSVYLCGKAGNPYSCVSNSRTWLALHKPKDFVRYDRFRRALLVNGEPITDHVVISLALEIEDMLAAPWSQEHLRSALTHIGRENEFSSLVEWLDGLKWDGTPRIEAFFADHYECDDTPYHREAGRVFFLSATARAYKPGCKVDTLPVLIGRQGVFKSYGMARLCPREDWFADDIGGEMSGGKSGEGLQGKWIVEFSELARVNRSTVEVAKSFISRQSDHYRPAYGREAQDFPRTCVFFGSTNSETPFTDVENRRYLPIRVIQGDPDSIAAARDQLWAEAVVRYKAAEKWWTTCHNLVKEGRDRADEGRATDAWETILSERLDGLNQTTVVEAAQLLGIATDRLGRSEQTRIGTALTAIGFESKQGPRPERRRYYVRHNPADGE